MLVLSRQRDETIMIGDEIEITVVDIRGDKVRLGITAPTRIAVHRKEVYESIRRENESACGQARIMAGDDLSATPRLSPGPARTRVASLAARPGGRDAHRSESQSGNGVAPHAPVTPARRAASER